MVSPIFPPIDYLDKSVHRLTIIITQINLIMVIRGEGKEGLAAGLGVTAEITVITHRI